MKYFLLFLAGLAGMDALQAPAVKNPAYIHGDVAESGFIPSGTAAAYDRTVPATVSDGGNNAPIKTIEFTGNQRLPHRRINAKPPKKSFFFNRIISCRTKRWCIESRHEKSRCRSIGHGERDGSNDQGVRARERVVSGERTHCATGTTDRLCRRKDRDAVCRRKGAGGTSVRRLLGLEGGCPHRAHRTGRRRSAATEETDGRPGRAFHGTARKELERRKQNLSRTNR